MTDTMFYWAIRRKADGAFLPSGRSRGFTFDEPKINCLPRLFRRRKDAKLALGQWLKGEYHVDYDRSYGLDGPDDSSEVRRVPRPKRVDDEMEVVRCSLAFDGGL
jgi:hypothetical protein